MQALTATLAKPSDFGVQREAPRTHSIHGSRSRGDRRFLGERFGGAEGAATRTRLSRDGGIDGIVDQDALGLARIYVQAKRYAPGNLVGNVDGS